MHMYQNAAIRHRDSVRALLFIILLTGGAAGSTPHRATAIHFASKRTSSMDAAYVGAPIFLPSS